MPEWVAYSKYEGIARDSKKCARDVPPRFRYAPVEASVPLALQGVSRFARKPAPCRCVVPMTFPAAYDAVRGGLRATSSFLATLAESMRGYVG